MIRLTKSHIARAAVLAGVSASVLLGTAAAANASQSATVTLSPGAQACVQQYASYQVRGEGTATGQGAKFKLTHNGVVVNGSPGLVIGWAAEARSSYGNFPGPGVYVVCATNNGSAKTTATLRILSDAEF